MLRSSLKTGVICVSQDTNSQTGLEFGGYDPVGDYGVSSPDGYMIFFSQPKV